VIQALRHSGEEFEVHDFSPYGYDERQYCSPGFNLPVGSLTRTPHGEFPEYHTSADNLDLVCPQALASSLAVYLSVIRVLENNDRYLNQNPKCEPQLGRRGLYRTMGGLTSGSACEMALLWVLNLSDGENALLDIAERSNLPFDAIHQAAQSLVMHGLLNNLSR
jgi:aminopeptidase-like protein